MRVDYMTRVTTRSNDTPKRVRKAVYLIPLEIRAEYMRIFSQEGKPAARHFLNLYIKAIESTNAGEVPEIVPPHYGEPTSKSVSGKGESTPHQIAVGFQMLQDGDESPSRNSKSIADLLYDWS